MKMDTEKLKKLERERSDKNYARSAVSNALKYGRLKKVACFCGEEKVEAHHENYSKPLDVIWVCRKHHVELDKKWRDREMKRNSAEMGLLLD